MSSFDKALSMGLVILPMPSVVLLRYTEDLQKGKKVDSIRYCSIKKSPYISATPDTESNKDLPHSATIYWVADNSFLLHVWEGHPGPSESDFIAPFQTINAALDAAIDLYFGKPTIIDSWIAPLHRHPELAEAQVRVTVAQAKTVTPLKFDLIQKDYQWKALSQAPNSKWEQALAGSFLRLPHTHDPQRSCMLLRSGQIAFIVQP